MRPGVHPCVASWVEYACSQEDAKVKLISAATSPDNGGPVITRIVVQLTVCYSTIEWTFAWDVAHPERPPEVWFSEGEETLLGATRAVCLDSEWNVDDATCLLSAIFELKGHYMDAMNNYVLHHPNKRIASEAANALLLGPGAQLEMYVDPSTQDVHMKIPIYLEPASEHKDLNVSANPIQETKPVHLTLLWARGTTALPRVGLRVTPTYRSALVGLKVPSWKQDHQLLDYLPALRELLTLKTRSFQMRKVFFGALVHHLGPAVEYDSASFTYISFMLQTTVKDKTWTFFATVRLGDRYPNELPEITFSSFVHKTQTGSAQKETESYGSPRWSAEEMAAKFASHIKERGHAFLKTFK